MNFPPPEQSSTRTTNSTCGRKIGSVFGRSFPLEGRDCKNTGSLAPKPSFAFRKWSSGIAFLAFLSSCTLLPAQQTQELQKLLEAVEDLAAKRSQQKEAGLRSVLNEIQTDAASGSSAVNSYTEAYKNVELAGKSAQAKELQEWKNLNRDQLNSPAFRSAAQLQMQYLALSLRRANSKKPEDFLEPSVDYLKELDASLKERARSGQGNRFVAEVMDNDLRNSLIAKERNLAPFFSDVQNWEWVPGNAAGILDKNIRPLFRKNKDPRLVESWDWQISMEEIAFQGNDRSHRSEAFRARRIPELRMQQAADLAFLGRPTQAAQQALGVMSQFPDHPEFDSWVDQTRGWLKESLSSPSDENPTPPEPSQDSSEPSNATQSPGDA